MRKRIYEVYFDKDETCMTNDNFSFFVRCSTIPNRAKILRALRKEGDKYPQDYHLQWIIPNTQWEYYYIKDWIVDID